MKLQGYILFKYWIYTGLILTQYPQSPKVVLHHVYPRLFFLFICAIACTLLISLYNFMFLSYTDSNYGALEIKLHRCYSLTLFGSIILLMIKLMVPYYLSSELSIKIVYQDHIMILAYYFYRIVQQIYKKHFHFKLSVHSHFALASYT